MLATCYHSRITCTLSYHIRITCILGSRLKAKSKARLKCFEMFVARAGTNMLTVLVPSSKEDIDVLENNVHLVIIKSYEAACPMRKSLRTKDTIWWNSELASLQKEAHRAWRKAIKTKTRRRLGGSKARPSLFQKSCQKSKARFLV